MNVRKRTALAGLAASLVVLLSASRAVAQPRVRCCDGTFSPTCTTPHQGCCSHHGGVCATDAPDGDTDAPEESHIPRIGGPPVIVSALPPAVVRRVVMAHLAEVRACYAEGVAVDPSASGRVLVRFVIGGDGRVVESNVTSSTYPLQSVAVCIAHAVARWVFPEPAGRGFVVVNYPFNLRSEEAAASPRPPARPRTGRRRSR